MSGGSMSYMYNDVEDVAKDLEHSSEPLRRALGKHLFLVAKALHDIEWVDSGDYGKGDEYESIKSVLGKNWKEITLETTLGQINEISVNLVKLWSEQNE